MYFCQERNNHKFTLLVLIKDEECKELSGMPIEELFELSKKERIDIGTSNRTNSLIGEEKFKELEIKAAFQAEFAARES